MRALCGLAADLGARVLVHGSLDQRALVAGEEDDGCKRGIDCFAAVAEAAAQARVVYCIEPLSRQQTQFINTVEEAAAIVRAIDSPAVRTMIDCSAAGQAEAVPVADLVRRWVPTGLIGHIHFNDPNRRGPGEGTMAFAPILAALAATKYPGDAAIEPFRLRARRPHMRRAPDWLSARLDRGRKEMSEMRLRLMEASFYEHPVELRLPVARFGVVTLTEAPQAFVRVRVRLADGREGEGISAELLVPKWFDKSPDLTSDGMISTSSAARSTSRGATFSMPEPIPPSASPRRSMRRIMRRASAPASMASWLHSGLRSSSARSSNALGRLEGASVFELVRRNGIALTAATAPDLAGFDFDAFLADLRPAPSIFARHTVGLVDALTRVDTAGKRLDDGLPESLEEVIATYGQRYFKLKVAGSLDADIDRLARIAAVLDRIPEPYFTTLDGNKQFEHVDAVIALWRRIAAEPRLARLKASILFIEQPIARTKALAEPIHALAREIPVEIGDSDADMGVFPAARALGYRGISAKSCKGFYRALLNRARIAHWNADREACSYFMSCEDLTTQGGIARSSRISRWPPWWAQPMWSATGTTM